MTTSDDEARDLRVEWLLRERLGGETPPDLTRRVVQALRAPAAPGEGPTPMAPPGRGSSSLAAALVLLGVGAVVAIALQADRDPAVTAGQGQEPAGSFVTWTEPKQVKSRADIEALPADTRQVFGIDLDDDSLPALLRLRRLEGLAMTVSTFVGGPGDFQQAQPVYLTDEGIARLAALPALRALVLEGQIRLQGDGLMRVVRGTGLREVNLVHMSVPNELLRSLAGTPLRALRLNYSQDFTAEGMRAIASCTTLRQISLIGCTHLEDDAIAQLAGMPQLEMLNLGMIGSHTMFSGIRRSPLPEPDPGSGVTDGLLARLAPLPSLRFLGLHAGGVTDRGLQSLSSWSSLRELRLGSMPEITAVGIAALPDGIESLSMVGHAHLNADLLDALLSRPHLRTLSLAWCRDLPADAVARVCAARQLEEIDVSGWQLSDAEKARLRALPALVRFGKDETNR